MREKIPERFKSKIKFTSSCWLYQGGTDRKGYSSVRFDNKWHKLHRLLFSILVTDIPDGMQLDHICRKCNCVNPKHLQIVSKSENLRLRNERIRNDKR